MSIFSEHFEEEIAHLNRLLDDSHLTTSALLQLLRDHNIPVDSTELIKAKQNVEAEIQTLRTANAGLLEKLTETQAALDLSARQLLETVIDRNSIGVQLDLLRDELMRIRARIGETGLIGEHPQLSSIALYCERAQHDIAVRYTPIQERDRLEREVLKLVEKVKRLEEVGDKMAELLDCYGGFNETEKWACSTRSQHIRETQLATDAWAKAKGQP